MTRRFTRTKEDFICEHCGVSVQGTGYTNHCPSCLWSKHVDINPGDREELCGGMMEPIAIETNKGEHMVVQRCVVCKHEKRNKVAINDNDDTLLIISKKRADS